MTTMSRRFRPPFDRASSARVEPEALSDTRALLSPVALQSDDSAVDPAARSSESDISVLSPFRGALKPCDPENACSEAIHDPAPRQIVGRELDPNAVTREDPDPVSPHAPGGIAERLVSVVEPDAVLAVAESLEDLAFEFDLLLFRHLRGRLDHVDRLRTLRALADLELDLGALAERLEAAAGDVRVMNEDVLRTVLGRGEAVALGVVEPLHGSACHCRSSLTLCANG